MTPKLSRAPIYGGYAIFDESRRGIAVLNLYRDTVQTKGTNRSGDGDPTY